MDRVSEGPYVDGVCLKSAYGVPTEDLYSSRTDGLFHIGQDYADEIAATVYCLRCGSTVFNVGTANHFTAIRCVTCAWESCIHDG